jgi:hypothetical protein
MRRAGGAEGGDDDVEAIIGVFGELLRVRLPPRDIAAAACATGSSARSIAIRASPSHSAARLDANAPRSTGG